MPPNRFAHEYSRHPPVYNIGHGGNLPSYHHHLSYTPYPAHASQALPTYYYSYPQHPAATPSRGVTWPEFRPATSPSSRFYLVYSGHSDNAPYLSREPPVNTTIPESIMGRYS